MTEEELLDEVIDQAVDRALELMGQRRMLACDTPPTLRLARALVREVFPIFRVEFHRPAGSIQLPCWTVEKIGPSSEASASSPASCSQRLTVFAGISRIDLRVRE